ncbi:hypothetical protein CC2G_008602 [Coprinopsis cinerea AmutBmut pab1-1]|nr:hypothetical protein CC2G_008602 [Coprinopsis cinerea AmutBmut pab1-1]
MTPLFNELCVTSIIAIKRPWSQTTISFRDTQAQRLPASTSMQQNDLKVQIRDAETLYSKATKFELSKRYDQAYEHYIRATELFLHITRSPPNALSDKERLKWKDSAKKALDRAEKVKVFTDSSRRRAAGGSPVPSTSSPASPSVGTGGGNGTVRLTPVAINPFAPHEQYYVLKKGSTINGLVYPLWDESEGPEATESPFHDPDGQPKLSSEQLEVSSIWKRPMHEFMSEEMGSTCDWEETPRILPQDIRQHVVSDCSVCASISVCLEHGRRFGSYLAESPLHHYCDAEKWVMRIGMGSKLFFSQKSGRFDFRMLVNGAWRRIVIDDHLPCNPADNSWMCMSISPQTKSPYTVWPSLLEKAYMKLMGGYDFPGSNSSIDLHAITGWIPEHVEIHRSDFERERTWQRISTGFLNGKCMVTLGTGTRPISFDSRIQLLPSHSYAVTDVFEADEGRMFTVLDSWAPETEDGKGVDGVNRMINVLWSDALNMFDGIYLSWDPSIWDKCITFHGMWKRQDPEDVTKQLFIKFRDNRPSTPPVDQVDGTRHPSPAEEDTEIWVLLTRHLSNSHRTQDFIALRVQVEDDVKGAVVLNQQMVCRKETYTNSTHILVRARLKPSDRNGILSVVASYDGVASEVGFTLNVYSPKDVDVEWEEGEGVGEARYSDKESGTFTLRTAGGNCTHPTFMINPQYRLVVHPAKPLSAALRAQNATTAGAGRMTFTLKSSKDIPVNVAVVRSNAGEERVTELAERDLIASSGPYTYGVAKVSKDIPPGEFTLILSTFDPETTGPFNLKIESVTNPFDVRLIPQEGAGMYSKSFIGSWDIRTSGGSISSAAHDRNPKYQVEVPTRTQFK